MNCCGIIEVLVEVDGEVAGQQGELCHELAFGVGALRGDVQGEMFLAEPGAHMRCPLLWSQTKNLRNA